MDPMRYVFGFVPLEQDIIISKDLGLFYITYGMVRLLQPFNTVPAGTEVFMQLNVMEGMYYAFDSPDACIEYGMVPVLLMQFPELSDSESIMQYVEFEAACKVGRAASRCGQ